MGRFSVLSKDRFTNSQLAWTQGYLLAKSAKWHADREPPGRQRRRRRGAPRPDAVGRPQPGGPLGRSAVNQPAIRRPRGLHHRLGERGVRVDDSRDLGVAALELARVDQLLDQVGGLDRADVGAEELAVLTIAHDL